MRKRRRHAQARDMGLLLYRVWRRRISYGGKGVDRALAPELLGLVEDGPLNLVVARHDARHVDDLYMCMYVPRHARKRGAHAVKGRRESARRWEAHAR